MTGRAVGHSEYDPVAKERRPWNAGRKLGAKRALKPQQVWAIRFWLDRERRLHDRGMFDLAIDSKLRRRDIVKIKIGDLVSGGQVRSRAIVVQQTGHGWPRRPIDGPGLQADLIDVHRHVSVPLRSPRGRAPTRPLGKQPHPLQVTRPAELRDQAAPGAA